MNGGDNGFPSGNGENTQLLEMFMCSLQTNIGHWVLIPAYLIRCYWHYFSSPVQYSPFHFSPRANALPSKIKKKKLSEELYYLINRQNFNDVSLTLMLKTLDKERKWRSITESASLNWMACLSTLLTECGRLSGWKWFTVSSLLDGMWISGRTDLYFLHFLSLFFSHFYCKKWTQKRNATCQATCQCLLSQLCWQFLIKKKVCNTHLIKAMS